MRQEVARDEASKASGAKRRNTLEHTFRSLGLGFNRGLMEDSEDGKDQISISPG
jgi:hypothetical protein